MNDLEQNADTPEQASSLHDVDRCARERHYNYADMLAAWSEGAANERKYGGGEGDRPDFATWIRERASIVRVSDGANH